MALIAQDKSGSFDFELTPEGNHIAVCYMVCDLGLHESNFQGDISTKRKVRLSWELPNELMEDGKPFSVSKTYTLSLSDKANLRKDLQSWRGKSFSDEELQGFDVFSVMGHACMLNVIHNQSNGNTYANIATVASLPKGMPAPVRANDLLAFSLDDYSEEIFSKLPDWLKSKINKTTILAPAPQQHPAASMPEKMSPSEIPNYNSDNSFDDDIPF